MLAHVLVSYCNTELAIASTGNFVLPYSPFTCSVLPPSTAVCVLPPLLAPFYLICRLCVVEVPAGSVSCDLLLCVCPVPVSINLLVAVETRLRAWSSKSNSGPVRNNSSEKQN